MKYDILYAVASDLIDKRDAGTNTSDNYICVCMSNSNIYTGYTKFDVVGTKLDIKYAEEEAVQNARKNGISVIEAMIIMNCKDRELTIPCQRCTESLININSQNNEMLVMQSDMQYIKLKDIANSFIPQIDGLDMSQFNPNLTADGEDKLQPADNPLDYTENIFNKDSVYQNKSRYLQSVSYVNVPPPVSTTVSQYIPTVQTTDANSRLKKRLEGLLDTESEEPKEQSQDTQEEQKTSLFNRFKKVKPNVKEVDIEEMIPKESFGDESKNTEVDLNEPHKPTRKELIKLAKDKKKAAKKDMKIREAFENKH
jgi:cytidine deaminase